MAIFYDLDGNEHRKELNYKKYGGSEARSSALSRALSDKIKELLPGYAILEEFPTVGLSPTLYIDFMILSGIRFAFEADGQQHDKFVPHFHGTRASFAKQKMNDVSKERWCIANNIKLIRVSSMEDVEKLSGAING